KGRNLTKDYEELKSLNTQSLTRRASAATCQFPAIMPETTPLDKGKVIQMNMDRVYASFLQTVIATNPMIDISVDRTPLEYLRRLHQNLKFESVIDFDELEKASIREEELHQFLATEYPDLKIPRELFTEEKDNRRYDGLYSLYSNADGSFMCAFKECAVGNEIERDSIGKLKSPLSSFNTSAISVTEANNNGSAIAQGLMDSILQQNQRETQRDEQRYSMDLAKNMQGPRMVEREAKRVNELQPYGLSVRLMAVNEKGEFIQYMDFIVGVKTTIHVVKSKEIVSNIENVLKNRNTFFNFIRWTTGEISFVKDFLLHLDDIKSDTSYRSRGSSPWFPTLKRLKDKKIELSGFSARKLVPNATLVLTSFEVNDIKVESGFDVKDMFFAKKIMKELFLLAFIIIDEGSGTIDILYEGADYFETYTLETLEREIDMTSN
ncbi:MAG: hypothetical protein K2L37_03880, partial [Lactobacillus sp.]|nr:hypothetical protein [Lactobacillus sp.]